MITIDDRISICESYWWISVTVSEIWYTIASQLKKDIRSLGWKPSARSGLNHNVSFCREISLNQRFLHRLAQYLLIVSSHRIKRLNRFSHFDATKIRVFWSNVSALNSAIAAPQNRSYRMLFHLRCNAGLTLKVFTGQPYGSLAPLSFRDVILFLLWLTIDNCEQNRPIIWCCFQGFLFCAASSPNDSEYATNQDERQVSSRRRSAPHGLQTVDAPISIFISPRNRGSGNSQNWFC